MVDKTKLTSYPEFTRFILAQATLLWLRALNKICSLSWLAAVQLSSFTQLIGMKNPDEDENFSGLEVWKLWVYTFVAMLVVIVIMYFVNWFRLKTVKEALVAADAAKAEYAAASSSSSSSGSVPVPPTGDGAGETKPKQLAGDHKVTSGGEGLSSPTEENEQQKQQSPGEPIGLSEVWAKSQAYRRKWVNTVTNITLDALVFAVAIGFSAAVRRTLRNDYPSNSQSDRASFVGLEWTYACGFAVFATIFKTLFRAYVNRVVRRSKSKQTQVQRSDDDIPEGIVLAGIERAKIINHKLTLETVKSVDNSMESALYYIVAIAFNQALGDTVQLNTNDDKQAGFLWLYTFLLLLLVASGLAKIHKWQQKRKAEQERLGLIVDPYTMKLSWALYKSEAMGILTGALATLPIFTIPYCIDVTMQHAADSKKYYILLPYAIGITILSGLIIIGLEIWVAESRIYTATSSRNLLDPNHIVLQTKSLFHSLGFRIAAGRMIARGLGLTVAFAWSALFVHLMEKLPSTHIILWFYAFVITFVATYIIFKITSSQWMQDSLKVGREVLLEAAKEHQRLHHPGDPGATGEGTVVIFFEDGEQVRLVD